MGEKQLKKALSKANTAILNVLKKEKKTAVQTLSKSAKKTAAAGGRNNVSATKKNPQITFGDNNLHRSRMKLPWIRNILVKPLTSSENWKDSMKFANK